MTIKAPKNSANSLLDAAIDYTTIGWPVFPLHGIVDGKCTCRGKDACHSPGKHPIFRGGFKTATTDWKTVREWWAKHPEANIGIPTGKETFDVLDIDGPEGEASLDSLEKEFGALPRP